LDVAIDAFALNNNTCHLARTMLLSRVAWDVSVPAPVYAPNPPYDLTTPTAGPDGLSIMFGVPPPSLRLPGVQSSAALFGPGYVPGFYSATDGNLQFVTIA